MAQQEEREKSSAVTAKRVRNVRFKALAHWEGVEQVPILFANHIFIHLHEGQFLLTFGRAELPYEQQLSEKARRKLKTEGIPIVAVARLAVNQEKMGQMIEQFVRIYKTLREG